MAGWIVRLSGLMAMLAMTACGTVPPGGPSPGTPAEVAELKQAILDLGPGVDPEEAARAASVAYSWTHELALKYQIRDNPIIHNTEVNLGLKPRGLCWQWAEDMEKRLKQENFHTLVIYRAIATPGNPFRLEHSTAIVSRKGDGMYQGLVRTPGEREAS